MIKVLLVDDAKSVHAFIKSCLTGKKIELFSAFDGKEALNLLEKNESGIQLVLMDWEMPVLTGLEAVKKMNESKMKIPVIMLTAKSSVDDISTMLNLGVNEYVMKPFTKDILVEKMSMVLGCEIV